MNEDRIKVEVLEALSGAERLQKRILSGIHFGDPSVEETAHLIKCRIKNPESLAKKVIDRRMNGNPAYTALSATDIVGLRLISLFKDDIPLLLRSFMGFVADFRSIRDPIFKGDDFHGVFKEIIIYGEEGHNDSSDPKVKEELNRLGFKEVDADEYQDGMKGVFRVVQKSSEYSSIHLVLSCNRFQTTGQEIPLEVQIRSVLEDAWGEIEHKLGYKASKSNAENESLLRKIDDHISEDLASLKKTLMGASESANRLNERRNWLKNETSVAMENYQYYTVNYQGFKYLDRFPESLSAESHRVKVLLEEIFGRIYNFNEILSDGPVSELDVKLVECADTLNDLSNRLKTEEGDWASQIYQSKLEAGWCYYWAVRLRSGDRKESEVVDDGLLRKSMELYVEASQVIPSMDPIRTYRIGQVNLLQGEEEIAIIKFEEAYQEFSSPEYQKNDPRVRVNICRSLGLSYWSRAQRYARSSLASIKDTTTVREIRGDYFKAIDVTMKAMLDERESGYEDWQKENSGTARNVIEYAVEFANWGGDWNLLREIQFDEAFVSRYKPELEAVDTPTFADTARLLAKYTGDRESERKHAGRVISMLDQDDWISVYGKKITEEMREDAENSLT